jgi:hypothetical protein
MQFVRYGLIFPNVCCESTKAEGPSASKSAAETSGESSDQRIGNRAAVVLIAPVVV